MNFSSPSDSKFTRHHHEEAEMVFSALDCVLNRERAIYCSSELTTGDRLYKALRKHGLKTSAELRKQLGEQWYKTNIWDLNVAAAVKFAQDVRRKPPGKTMVITPAPFAAPGWSQPEYLSFWETLLRTRIQSAWFNSNWQYSNGCVFEFAVAHDAGLPTFDDAGQALDLSRGIELINRAIEELEEDGFDTSKLRENRNRLRDLPQSAHQAFPAR